MTTVVRLTLLLGALVSPVLALSSPNLQDYKSNFQTTDGDESWHLPWRSHHPNEYTAHKESQVIHDSFSGLNPLLEKLQAPLQKGNSEALFLPQISRHMIEVRDGVKLDTIVINPYPHHKKKAAVLSRSPYGPTSDQIAQIFMGLNGYAAVIQDQRGTFLSEGNFSLWRKDGNDGYDTMEWLSHQHWFNGEVFSVGISADGCGALTQLLNKPKWLKGQLIMWASADAHATIYPGGAFREGLIGGWMTVMSVLTRGYSLKHTLKDIMKHESLSPWYDPIEAGDKSLNVNYPTIHISGWWDIFQNEHLETWKLFSEHSTMKVRNNHTLFVGPLGHCLLFSANLALNFHETQGILGAFMYAAEEFRGDRTGPAHKKYKRVNFFVQGEPNKPSLRKPISNFWTSLDDLPQASPTRFYLSSGNSLVSDFDQVKRGKRSYTYDPTDPVKTHGGNNLLLAAIGHGCGSMDQQQIEQRDDVITFTTAEPLKEPLVITGKLISELYVASDRNDTDFVVSLNDVYPDGRSMQVRYGIQRMKYRYLAKEAAPLDAQIIYRIEIDMAFTSYVFNKGHQIRFTVTSSSAPYIKPNSNFNSNVLLHSADNSVKATNTVLFSPFDYPSFVELPVVELKVLQDGLVH